MKFSIIVPVYNAEAFIVDTINNLLDQKVEKEIILINDGSTDSSLSLINQFERENDCIKVIDKINGGVSSARNLGLDVATGDYICFVDSDDALEPGTLLRCQDILLQSAFDAVFFSYKYVFSKKREYAYNYLPTGAYSFRDWLSDFINLESTHIVHCIGTTIYRKDILDKEHIRFNQDISYLEDVCFCFQYLSNVRKIYYIDEPLYHYNVINPNSLISKPRLGVSKSILSLIDIETSMFKSVYGNDIPYKEMYGVFGNCIIGAIGDLFNLKNIEKGRVTEELANFSSYEDLMQCITYSTSDENKQLLELLLVKSDTYKFRLYRKHFRRIRIKNNIVKNLRAVKYFFCRQ